jgi:prepilin-type N-terminal cleavage/methylation domain-containing protein
LKGRLIFRGGGCISFSMGYLNLMSFTYRDKKTGMAAMRSDESGFSMVELMIVCVIMVIISAIAVPNIVMMNRNYKLDAAGHSVASLLQQARMQAVKLNQPQYAQYDGAGVLAFVNDGSSNTYATGNPDVGLPGGIAIALAAPAQNLHDQLDAYIGLGGTPAQIGGNIGFNARGLPCNAGVSPAVCTSATGGYEWFMQNGQGGWEAVTVTPSGRIKSWRLTQATNGTCGYAACWQ